MKDRIKLIRQSLRKKPKVSQTEFAQMLGTTRPAIASYETGKVTPSDTFIQLMCSKFNVNEHWLRTGEGDIFIKNDEAILSQVVEQYHLNHSQLALVKSFLALDNNHRNAIVDAILEAAQELKLTRKDNVSLYNQQEANRIRLHSELDAAIDAEEKDALVSSSGNSGTMSKYFNK